MRGAGRLLTISLWCAACATETSTPPSTRNSAAAPASASQAPVAAAAPATLLPATLQSASPAAGSAASTVLGSGQTIWPDVVAEVLEFRRRGSVLTAQVRLRRASSTPPADVSILVDYHTGAYVIDAVAGKKYQLLRDEVDAPLASLSHTWKDKFQASLAPSASLVIWAKFPAPPPDVRTASLVMPGIPALDLQIQDQ